MERISVSSSNIRSIGYDAEKLLLEIEFHSKAVYQYSNVPILVFENLKSAISHGSYFSKNIKDVYTYRKV